MPDMPVAWAPKEKHDSMTDYQVQTIGYNETGFSQADYSTVQKN